MLKMPELSFAVPAPEIAAATLMTYPSTQCRLDTMKAGALCPVSPQIPFSFDDVRRGACGSGGSAREAVGARPRCWFKGAH